MSDRESIVSTEFAWTEEQMATYHDQYRRVSDADSQLAQVAIRSIVQLDERRALLGQLDSALIIGAGGVPRGAGILCPP